MFIVVLEKICNFAVFTIACVLLLDAVAPIDKSIVFFF